MHPKSLPQLHCAASGTVLLLTIMMLVLLTFEVAVISLVAQRGLGEEGMLQSQHIAARRGGETVLSQLESALHTYLQANDGAAAETAFNYGGSNYIAQSDLMITPPGGGADIATDVKVTAWVSQRRGIWYKLTARAQDGSVDLLVHRWIKMNPCKTSASLQTIVNGVSSPGVTWWGSTTKIDSTGRVYFATDDDEIFTWKDGVLSTLVTGSGGELEVYGDDRLYISRNAWDGGVVLSWKESTGLSTLVGGTGWWSASIGNSAWGNDSTELPGNDTVLFTAQKTSGNYWVLAHSLSYGLSTLLTNQTVQFSYSPASSDGRVMFYDNSAPTSYLTWKASTGLSTVISDHAKTGPDGGSFAIDSGNRFYFGSGQQSTNSNLFWTWKESTGLSTLLTATNNYYFKDPVAVSGDDVLFAHQVTAAHTARILRWRAATGLSTINIDGAELAANHPATNQMFWVGWDELHRWNSTDGLSTMLYADFVSDVFVNDDGRVYITRAINNPDHFWTWKTDTGLSTIMTFPPGDQSIVQKEGPNGRLYFNQGSRVWTWSETDGLSTIITGETNPADLHSAVVDANGALYFGETAGSGSFWRWSPPEDCNDRGF